MSVDWDRIRTGLTLFANAARAVAPERVFWEREANPITYDDVLLLRISAERAHGFDDVVMEENDDGDLVPRITGIREFVCSFRISSRSQTTAARKGLERVRASLHHPGRLEILYDHGIGFLSTEPLVTLDEVSHERWESLAVLDVRFCTLSEMFDGEDDETSLETLHAVGVDVRTPTDSIDGSPLLITEPP